MAVKVLMSWYFNNVGPKRPATQEVHFYNASPTNLRDAVLNAAVIQAMNARTQLMGNNLVASLYRLSVPGRKLRSYTVYATKNSVITPGMVTTPSLNQGACEIPNGSLQLTMSTAQAQVRQMYMAGLPDVVFSTGGIIGPTFSDPNLQQYAALWGAWKNIMLNGNWGSVFLNILPNGQPQQIGYWVQSPNAPGNLQFVLPNAAAYKPNVGDIVHIRGVLMFGAGVPRPVGKWRVIATGAQDANNTFFELDKTSAYQAILVDQPGTVESVSFGFQSYAAFDNAQQTSRKRGIGPVRPRGRSRRPARRQPS
jgi:hypothetical protein